MWADGRLRTLEGMAKFSNLILGTQLTADKKDLVAFMRAR
jgi:hypothetical protein